MSHENEDAAGDAAAEVRAQTMAMLADLRRHGLRLRLTVDGSGHLGHEVQELRSKIEEWSSSLIGLLITDGPRDLGWLERLASAGASTTVAERGAKLPWPRGLCPNCKDAVLVWEIEPRCPQCRWTEGQPLRDPESESPVELLERRNAELRAEAMASRSGRTGVLADHWSWGPPLAIVVVPRAPGTTEGDHTFIVIRSWEEDIADRSYEDVERRWLAGRILTRDEAPSILGQMLLPEELRRVLGEVDRALGDQTS